MHPSVGMALSTLLSLRGELLEKSPTKFVISLLSIQLAT